VKRAVLGLGLGSIAAVAALGVGTAGAHSSSAAAPQRAAATCTGKIALMAPITGDAASLGQEQRNWARYAIKTFNAKYRTKITLSEGDTQLNPAQATTVGRKYQSDSSILGVVGPAGSQEVQAVGPIFGRAKLAFISMSATRVDLTSGKNPTFFRVVPTDGQQGPTDADYMIKTLHAKTIYIIDDQTSYSTGLADQVTSAAKKLGVSVTRDSVAQSQTDFSSLVSKVNADVVFLPWQIAANAQLFATQMQEQNKSAKLMGSDGVFSSDFHANGAYVSSFAPDIRGIAADKALVAGYVKAYNDKFGTFGPPTYAATWVLASAVRSACGTSGKASRSAVLSAVKKTNQPSILGYPIKFSSHGDVSGARFHIFVVKNGKFTPLS
jgi:branched-chain amino acid transport system substrate-binding protein